MSPHPRPTGLQFEFARKFLVLGSLGTATLRSVLCLWGLSRSRVRGVTACVDVGIPDFTPAPASQALDTIVGKVVGTKPNRLC